MAKNQQYNENLQIIKDGILGCCEDIKNNIDKIMKNVEGKCTGVTISIDANYEEVPRYSTFYEYASDTFIKLCIDKSQLNKNKKNL